MTTPSLTTPISHTSSSPSTSTKSNPNEWAFPGQLPNGIVATVLGSLTGGLFLIGVLAAIWWARSAFRQGRGPWAHRARFAFDAEDDDEQDQPKSPPEMFEVVLVDQKGSHTELKLSEQMPLSFTLLPYATATSSFSSVTSDSHTTLVKPQAVVSYLIAMPCAPRAGSASASAASASSGSSRAEEDDEDALPEMEIGSSLIDLMEGDGGSRRVG